MRAAERADGWGAARGLRAVACGPFPQGLQRAALFKARGDMHAGEIKAVKEAISVRQELPLLVAEGEAPEVYKAAADDAIEVGPFEVCGTRLLPWLLVPRCLVDCAARRGAAGRKALAVLLQSMRMRCRLGLHERPAALGLSM